MMTSFEGGYDTISTIFKVLLHFQSLCFSKIVTQSSVKIDYGNFELELDLSEKIFDLQAVLSVTGSIGCIVFKWVENTNSNGP